jgi:hypothetical protein
MGTYHHLYFAGYPVVSLKGEVEPVAMTIFRESDKRTFRRKVSERNPLTWGHIEDDGETETAYEYSNTVANVKQRLDVIGFTLERVRKDLARLVDEEIENARAHRARVGWPCEDVPGSQDVDTWLQAFRLVLEKKLTWESKVDAEPPVVQCIVKNRLEECFPYEDLRCLFRAFIEVCPEDAAVTLDVTDLVENGYYSHDYPVCNAALERLAADYAGIERTIVLTEGSSDKAILDKSLKILYPHLYDYYSFMDFDLSNAPGGRVRWLQPSKPLSGLD